MLKGFIKDMCPLIPYLSKFDKVGKVSAECILDTNEFKP